MESRQSLGALSLDDNAAKICRIALMRENLSF